MVGAFLKPSCGRCEKPIHSIPYIVAYPWRGVYKYYSLIIRGAKISSKWIPYSKGGNFRRWYGNLEYVINWENNAEELRTYSGAGLGASKYFGSQTIVWTKLTNYKTGFRWNSSQVYFDDASPAFVGQPSGLFEILAFLNSKVAETFLQLLSPTINYQCGEIKNLPIKVLHDEIVKRLSKNCISLSRADWDTFETSWDFKKHPLI